MSVGTKLLQAAAGNAGEAVYVDDVFSTNLWTGNGGTQSIVNDVDLSGEGGLVWIKNREQTYNHYLTDTERGATKQLSSNTTGAEVTSSARITAFNSNGFTLGGNAATNGSTNGIVGWTFRKQEKFFDVLTYTGDGTDNRAIAHNLGSVPGMIIVKVTSHDDNWIVYHRSLGYTKLLRLNMTNAAWTQDRWGDQNPTSTQFYVDNNAECNQSGYTYVAYLFAHDEQDFGENSDEAIIHCGSYTGTGGSGTGPVINLGFEPQWMLVKQASDASGGNFMVMDTMRGWGADGSNNGPKNLRPNTNEAEFDWGQYNYDLWTVNPTGFTIGPTDLYNVNNTTGATYVYVAIAKPHKPASEFAANKLFSMDGAGDASGDPDFVSNGHVVDWAFLKLLAGSEGAYATARPTGSTYISLSGVDKEYSDSTLDKDFQSGFGDSASTAVANYQAWMFRRAKGFFDIVTYDGTGSDRTQTHNLGVAPELILIKRRGPSNADWVWYVGPLGAGNYMYGDAGAKLSSTTVWNNTSPTESVFSLGAISSSYYRTNGSGSTYIAVLWATVAGISKVGSYTGTGSDLNVDCGFSAGARFVLIKRTDGTEGTSVGGWYVFDSERGIVAGNDPYFLLNSSAAQVTNTDYIDPLSSGFTVTSSASAELNASGGNYIFLAIA